ncbi:MAG: GAF domain-containing protein [Candidatus Aminicenantes bacterium]
MDTKERLIKRYQNITGQLKNLLSQTPDQTARMSSVCALLHHKMPNYFWTGFYLLKKDRLIVGPYQGPLACQVLSEKKGVCWTAVLEKRSVIVPDVHKFPSHIACDSRSNSEIAVPWLSRTGRVLGVLDVDSRKFGAFSESDEVWLGKIVRLLNRRV